MNVAATAAVRIGQAPLCQFSRRLLEAAGATEGHANTVVDHLLEADAMGLRSHGFMRLPQYLAEIASGEIDPAAEPALRGLAPGRAEVDGGRGFGQVVGAAIADAAIRLARETGVSFVAGRHMGHTGRIGAYSERVAREGLVGIAVCSGPRSGHWVAPFGGREGRISTNPIAFAAPRAGAQPVSADFSTSVAPEGVIRSLMNRGLPAPPGALRDSAGWPTSDPAALYAKPRGAIQPFGGSVGYRGTALAILVEILAALLVGDEIDDVARKGSNLAMIAIRADGGFSERAERMAAYLAACMPIDPTKPVMIPGDPEHSAAARLGPGAIEVDGPTWKAMCAAAGNIEIPSPSTNYTKSDRIRVDQGRRE
jgi:LDH2 family malate/lactate/ureidoglycolate dehydrogenase